MLKEVDKKNIRVLYILGSGHSGSTLLDCILGNNPNVFSVGELSFYNVIKNHIPHAKTKHRKGDFCACGEKMSNCSFWKRIIKIDGNKFHIKKTYTKQENFNYLSQSSNLSRLKRGNFKNADFELLKLIASESGRSVILDSSKDPRRLLDLYREQRISLNVIYLVRDGRDYMLSMSRERRQRSGLPRQSYLTSLFQWVIVNWISRRIVKQHKFPYLKISYRQLCESPKKTIALISQSFEIPLVYSENNKERHNLSGNINTLNQKKIKINYRENWKSEMSSGKKFFATILFFPFRKWLEEKI